MYADLNRNPVQDGDAFVDSNGTKYPCCFPKDEISELTAVTTVAMPVPASTDKVTGFTIDETYTQVWTVVPKTQADIDWENAN